jgi:hypothetical protein
MGSTLWRATAAMSCALVLLIGAPAGASAFGTVQTLCEGTLEVTYTPAITALPGRTPISVDVLTSGSLTCTGVPSGTATITMTGTSPAGTTCGGPLLVVGSATITTTFSRQVTMTWVAAGTTEAQVWAFAESTSTPTAAAAGAAGSTAAAADVAGCAPPGGGGSLAGAEFTAAFLFLA